MNKSELIAQVAKDADISMEKSDRVINAFMLHVMEELALGKDFCLVGFGSFSQVIRSARHGRNPATGARVYISASISIKFKAGAAFKRALTLSE